MKNPISILQFIGSLLLLFISVLIGTGCPDPDPPPVTCAPPSNIEVTAIGPNSATLSWSMPPNTTVEISVSPDPNPPGPFTTTDSSFVLTGLLPNTNYEVTLVSRCPNGGTSDPVKVLLRTTGIIIVDVIIQKEQVSGIVKEFCINATQDILGAGTSINWDNSFDIELLKIENGSTRVFLLKEKNSTTGNFKYSTYESGTSICGENATNAPSSVLGTATSAATLTGLGYKIELDNVGAKMLLTPTNTPTGIYSMYR